MSYRVMLVDDEPLARERLKRLLMEHDNFDWVAEAGDGASTVEWLRSNSVDLVLLDIQMPELDGLQTAQQLQQLPNPPLVVFCTAYEEHALQAFSVQALDYLLKPVGKENLSRALQRAAQWLQQKPEAAAVGGGARTHLSARTHAGLQLIPVEEVLFFSADHKYVSVFHEGGETLIDDSLRQLEDEFGERFLRVHRSTLVARSRIERLESQPGGGHCVFLRGHDGGIAVSRRHVPVVRRAMREL
ncbi:DNA-binding response regulator [Bacterioplanes sanyensis]|jgi:two-component system response regulator AlgR|uniref:LytR/AlgR family response regulator transcription factor n=1 Tax=Bacterioplanes sanyensis TaxID=1249553 RepID=UPI001674FF51|nr:LytTR family DNA-binding domain-containing protein [Bacterioplanes sanyensis]GGY56165.1 DNA-binding response regulator [Bacterioplanes sanyensis]